MFISPKALEPAALRYCGSAGIQLGRYLGHGVQGCAWSTNRDSALKILGDQTPYVRERDVYVRLQELKASEVQGFIVPRLKGFDDALFGIEMTLVSPPFVLDFGGAYLDQPPEHMLNPEIRGQWEIEKREQFEEQWPNVLTILAEFERRYGIYIADVNPGNIQFG